MSDQPTDKDWVEHWRRVGPILEEIRREELRNFNYEEQLPIIDALLELGLAYAVPRPTSGLVELQRLFMKAHYKQNTGASDMSRPDVNPGAEQQ